MSPNLKHFKVTQMDYKAIAHLQHKKMETEPTFRQRQYCRNVDFNIFSFI